MIRGNTPYIYIEDGLAKPQIQPMLYQSDIEPGFVVFAKQKSNWSVVKQKCYLISSIEYNSKMLYNTQLYNCPKTSPCLHN